MKLDNSKIQFSLNDKKRGIVIPTKITKELAEDIGFHMGDGYMKERTTASSHNYNFVYAGHSTDDRNYFEKVLIPRKKRLFNVNAYYKKYNKNTKKSIELVFNSKAILMFYRDALNVKESPKINMHIPHFILDSNPLKRAFLRGLMDSDGCLTFLKKYRKVPYYPVIRLITKDKVFFNDLKKILNSFGFTFVAFRSEDFYKKRNKTYIRYRIDLNGVSNLYKWTEEVGFNNQRHIRKFLKWAEQESNLQSLPCKGNVMPLSARPIIVK